MFDVAGRIVVITGGMGKLGSAYVASLREAGALVAVLDRHVPVDQGDDHAVYLTCDVTRRSDLERALAQIVRIWGTPHALINNAALDSPPDASAAENGPFEMYPEESWDRVFEVNVKGVFLCCQVVGGAMASAGRGSIVNVSSIYGVVSPDQRIYEYRRRAGAEYYKPVAYSASKSALVNLTRYLATYWARSNVRVNTLTLAGVEAGQDAAFMEAYLQRIPIGRMAHAADYVGPVIFLCSDASAYMTGANLVVDGGWTAW